MAFGLSPFLFQGHRTKNVTKQILGFIDCTVPALGAKSQLMGILTFLDTLICCVHDVCGPPTLKAWAPSAWVKGSGGQFGCCLRNRWEIHGEWDSWHTKDGEKGATPGETGREGRGRFPIRLMKLSFKVPRLHRWLYLPVNACHEYCVSFLLLL